MKRITISMLFASLLASVATAGTLLQDDFSGGLEQWTLENSAYWSVIDGVLDVDIPSVDYTFARAIGGNVNWTDYRFDFDVVGLKESSKICYFRYHDVTKGYFLNFRSAVPAEGDPGAVRLFRLTEGPGWPWGSWHLLAAVPYVNQQGTWYHVTVEVIGNAITVLIDHSQVLYYLDTDDPILDGRVGLAGFTGANFEQGQHVQFDNVLVSSPTVPTKSTTWGAVKALYR